MAISSSAILLPAPAAPPARVIALRPVASGEAGARAHTGTRPQVEAEALREDELFRLRADPAEGGPAGGGPDRSRYEGHAEDDGDFAHHPGETPSFPGGTAAFLAQAIAAEAPDELPQDPFGDAARAYGGSARNATRA